MKLPQQVTYIARDIERALGVPPDTEGYSIISNKTTFAKGVTTHDGVSLIESAEIFSTQDLLKQSDLPANTNILVFKNTKAIERIAAEKKLNLLNPPAMLANKIEEKISQLEWLKELEDFLPPHHVTTCKELFFEDEPYIVQFNHAHSGEGTKLIALQKDIDELKETFPERPVRVTKFVDGPVYTINAVVHAGGVLVSSPSYQITGLPPFTDNAFTTIGNDWGAAERLLPPAQKETIKLLATEIGMKMKRDGWKGLFGIDVVVEETSKKVYLIEINARQPASTTYESQLQASFSPLPRGRSRGGIEASQSSSDESQSDVHLSTFEAHLKALLGEDLSEYTLVPVTKGAQILQRVTNEIQDMSEETISGIRALDCNVITYDERKTGVEMLRIQSTKSFIEDHNMLSTLGKDIAEKLKR